MLDVNDLLISIKKAAKEAVEASKPCDFLFGKVISTKPLKISVEQKMALGSAQLVLTRNVTDFATKVTVDSETENEDDLTGTKRITIHNALRVGEKVVLLKQKGGQKYLVLDRVVNNA